MKINRSVEMLRSCIFMFIFSTDFVAGIIKLSPVYISVIENKSLELNCSFDTPLQTNYIEWSKSDNEFPAFVHLDSCSESAFLEQSHLYTVNCGNLWSSVSMKTVDRNQSGVYWQCGELGANGMKSNEAHIFVYVPVTSVDIISHAAIDEISIKENTITKFTCQASPSRPMAMILWYLKNPYTLQHLDITTGSVQSPPTGSNESLIAVQSHLNSKMNRSLNGWHIYCRAANGRFGNVTSQEKTLNILYPPDSAPKILGYGPGKPYRIIESENGKLTCTITGGNPLANLSWNCFDIEPTPIKIVNRTVTSVIKWEAMRNQNVCTCESYHIYTGKLDAYVNVDVMYPPSKPFFIVNSTSVVDVVNIIQNNTLNISCKSVSNPSPNYTWNGPGIVNIKKQVLRIKVTHINDEERYTCTAENMMVRADNSYKNGNNASDINVKMLYPPRQLNCSYGKQNGHPIRENSLNVIKGDSFSIYCDADGYPSPAFKWDNFTNGQLLNIIAITSDTEMTCTATNWMNETVGESRQGVNSASFSISVLYPPSVPTIRISNGIANEVTNAVKISIIETDTIELSCDSKSKPKPSYTWFTNKSKLADNRNVTLANISRMDAGNYTCRVNNLMIRTFGDSETRTNTSSTFLNVLYPSDVGPLTNISLNEESTLNITCPVRHGNPLNTSVFWTRKIDDRRWNNTRLIIQNVSRDDDTVYTCTVFNEMIPTFGITIKNTRSSEFHLNIFFSAGVRNFSMLGKEYKGAIVVNETEDVSLSCTADGNPVPDITIGSPKHELIAMTYNTNTLRHTLRNVSYGNAGQYICTGRNNYTNGVQSSLKLILIVRCPPRPSSDLYYDGTVATTLHTDAVLQFTAHDFLDEPDKTVFTWFKANNSIGINGRKFVIASSGLQSNLSIRNITERDFGQYRLRVTNSVGNYLHIYKLQAKDKPDMPKDFTYIEDSITDSSVTVKWVPGFNGGYPQTFILLYKRMEETIWQNKSTKDSGDRRHMNYTLIDLFSETEYQVQMFARNEEGESAYTDTLRFSTKAPKAEPVELNSSDMVRIVAGSVSSVIIVSVAGIIFGVFVYKRRNVKETGKVYQNVPFSGKQLNTAATSKRNQTTIKNRKPEIVQIEETTFEGLQDVDDVPILTNERTEYCNSPDVIEKLERIQVSELFWYVSEKSEDMFEADYQKLPTELQKPCTCARKPENIALNRYNGIYPYDHSRVTLEGHPDFFINACYIDGYKSSKTYIASLGPTAKTTRHFETFWQMIWYERSDIIVMLTNLREPSGMKCEQYWPKEGKTEQYGDVCVSSQTTEAFAEYTITKFSVSCDEERRSLTHLHYTAWPDKTVPEDVTSLIEFRQRMKITPTSSEGPIVVHCSAGIGRTGTLIALDRLIEEGQDKGSVDVFECVNNMREQRVKMVQTHEQYIYIHKALVNALTFDCEALPVETFNEYVDTTNNNMYSRLFQQLRQTVEKDSKAEADDRVKNESLTDKNRQGADIPGRKCRVLLYLDRRGEGSEYINAVYINSFKKKDYFISTQSPLTSTVTDFIAMIYQENCSCIVTMENLKEPGMKVGKYLPDGNHTLTLGNFMVSCSVLETKHHYVVRKMKIKYAGQFESGEKSIYHFQYTKWLPGHDTPANAEEFVQFVHEVEEYASELGEERSHVVVHCLKANERSGLFCAVAILMEKIKFEGQVSVSNTLRHLRTRRRTAIISMEQLKFCYLAACAYIKKYLK